MLIVAQVAVAVAVLPTAIRQGGEMVGAAFREPGFAAGEYVSTQVVVAQDADASATAGATYRYTRFAIPLATGARTLGDASA